MITKDGEKIPGTDIKVNGISKVNRISSTGEGIQDYARSRGMTNPVSLVTLVSAHKEGSEGTHFFVIVDSNFAEVSRVTPQIREFVVKELPKIIDLAFQRAWAESGSQES